MRGLMLGTMEDITEVMRGHTELLTVVPMEATEDLMEQQGALAAAMGVTGTDPMEVLSTPGK